MTATTADVTTTASRTPLLALLGFASSAVLMAVGTFWDITNNDKVDDHDASEYLIVLGIAAVALAIVYGLVVRTAAKGNPGRRAAIMGVVGFLSNAAFWAGFPMVIASGVLACALVEKDRKGSFGVGSKVGLVLAALTSIAAVSLAITG
jgi:hypothetical protein